MKFKLSFLLILMPLFVHAQEPVKDGVYRWPTFNQKKKAATITMLSGRAYDLAYMKVSAQFLSPGKMSKVHVPNTEEHLLFVKSGAIIITMKDSIISLGKGSIAMMMPNEKYILQNKGTATCEMQVMKYKSKLPVDLTRGRSSGGSFVKDWNKLTFRPQERGGVRSLFDRPTANTKRFEMHVTTLKENFKSHDPHQHRAEEIIIVLEGKIEMLIGATSYQASAGDVLFASTNVFHGLKNIGNGTCSYYAFQWE